MSWFRRAVSHKSSLSTAFLLALFGSASACGADSGTGSGGGAGGLSNGGVAGTSPVGVSGSAGANAQGGSGAQAGSAPAAGNGGMSLGGEAQAGAATAGGAAGGSSGGGGATSKPDVAFCSKALDAAALQFAGFRTAYTSASSVPRSAKDGTVSNVGIGDWTFGFVGGSYWYLYEYTKDEAFRTAAEATTAALEPQKNVKTSHDLGFEFMSTYGNGYRLVKTASYLDVMKTAAASLATRYRKPVGVIQSWDRVQYDCPVIIDNMMNLRLLYFISQNGDASLADLATTHALTTIKNHFRADNSSFHLVNYNSTTGAVIAKQTVQGLADGSAWARGQSWGLYGYTESFVASKKPEFLAQAQKVAAFLMTHKNMPPDKVPYWDYDAPDTQGAPTPRDASAAAVMASGLLQLATLVAEPDATKYRDYALDILKSLSSPAYAAAFGQNSHFLLMHSTGHLPANIEIDAAINYADYYYLEALLRCRALAN
jgi:unsaturated chondroitin disaccharide hydrolase